MRNGQVGICVRVVGAWNLFLVFFVLFISFLLCLPRKLLLHRLLGRLTLLLVLCLSCNVHIDVHFVFFFVRVDLFRVIDIDREVKWLVFHFGTGNISAFGGRTARSLGRGRDVRLHRLAHGVIRSCWHVVSLLFTIEFVTDFEGFASLLWEAVIVFTIHFLSNLNYTLICVIKMRLI